MRDPDDLYAALAPSMTERPDEQVEAEPQAISGPTTVTYAENMVQWLTDFEDELLTHETAAVMSPETRIAKIEVIRLLKNKIRGDLEISRSE